MSISDYLNKSVAIYMRLDAGFLYMGLLEVIEQLLVGGCKINSTQLQQHDCNLGPQEKKKHFKY